MTEPKWQTVYDVKIEPKKFSDAPRMVLRIRYALAPLWGREAVQYAVPGSDQFPTWWAAMGGHALAPVSVTDAVRRKSELFKVTAVVLDDDGKVTDVQVEAPAPMNVIRGPW